MKLTTEKDWLEFWLALSSKNPDLLPVTIRGRTHQSTATLRQRLEELKK